MLYVLRERNRDIASFMRQPVYTLFQVCSALILVFYFGLLLFTQSACVKANFS